ncbi:MAG: flagellar FliJ family protein [Polyangiaceae bacterium]
MNSKRKKIQKVLELREQALEKSAGALARSREKLAQAKTAAEKESERLLVASEHRAQLATQVTDVGAWIEAEQWLAYRRGALGRATGQVYSAEAAVQESLQKVVVARMDKKKIELLDERLAEEQLRRELRVEQKLSDEFGQRRRPDTDEE